MPVLLLYSDTGGGHRAAARALRGAIRGLAPELDVVLLDPLLGEGPRVASRLAALYPLVARGCRPCWSAAYHATDTRATFGALQRALGAGVRRAVARRLAALRPALVLSVHPLVNHAAAAAAAAAGGPPLGVVTTDLVAMHRGWACPAAALVAVPTEPARDAALRLGVAAGRLLVTGVPIDPAFRPARPGEAAALRRRLGLDPGRATLLLASGGDGAGPVLEHVRALAGPASPWQVVVVCGRNERLRRRLAGLRLGAPVLPLGFVDTMPELMRAADLAIGKAGSLSIAEAQASGLPMAITSCLPGQETPNVAFAVEAGFARWTPRPDDLRRAVDWLLGPGQGERWAMAVRARLSSRPEAAVEAARACLALIGTAVSPGTAPR
jgi:UDP-N-acetylglucosamine:LPS N-acetylglucosamine transferase